MAHVVEPHVGSGDIVHIFQEVVHGLVLINDSKNDDILFRTNGYEFILKPGERFDYLLKPYKILEIKTKGKYRFWGIRR